MLTPLNIRRGSRGGKQSALVKRAEHIAYLHGPCGSRLRGGSHSEAAAASEAHRVFTALAACSARAALRRAEYAWPEGRVPMSYHDIKWNEAGTVLYAAGKDTALDIYGLV